MTFAQLLQLNIAHWIGGALLVFAGVIAYRNANRPPPERKWPRGPAKAMLGLGLGLVVMELIDPLIHKTFGGQTDPMVLYHSAVGVLAALAGGTELYRSRRPDAPRWLMFVFPAAWLGVGVVFLIHEQASDLLLYRHWAFAIAVTLAGLAKLGAELGAKVSEKTWGVFAILAGLNFVFYWESTETPMTTSQQTANPHQHGM